MNFCPRERAIYQVFMNVKNRMVKPRWRKQFRVFENDNLVFKNGIKPLGADADACNSFWAIICP